MTIERCGSRLGTEDLPRTFDPYFTTKAGDSERWLGVSSCQRILREYGCWIYADSVAGIGARITILLPNRPRSRVRGT